MDTARQGGQGTLQITRNAGVERDVELYVCRPHIYGYQFLD